MESEVLIEFCKQNPQLLEPDQQISNKSGKSQHKSTNQAFAAGKSKSSKEIPTLGKLLYKNDPWAFLEILINTRDHISCELAMNLLHANEDLNSLDFNYKFLLECYLEWVLLDSQQPTPDACLCLAKLYLFHIIYSDCSYPSQLIDDNKVDQNEQDTPTSRAPIRIGWRMKHKRNFIQKRAAWLNRIDPFSSINIHPIASSPFSTVEDDPAPTLFYLQKLQGLLCTENLPWNKTTIEQLLTIIQVDKDYLGKISLEILCLPLANRLTKAINILCSNFPSEACEFGIQYCKTPSNWQLLLDALSFGDPSNPIFYTVYQDVIAYLAQILEPQPFLELLPPNGNIEFFLPFIHKCLRYHAASLLKLSIVKQAKAEVK